MKKQHRAETIESSRRFLFDEWWDRCAKEGIVDLRPGPAYHAVLRMWENERYPFPVRDFIIMNGQPMKA